MVSRAAPGARNEAGCCLGCAVGVFHAVSSPVGPDQTGGHDPRPSVTIRQRSHRAAVVGVMAGPTTRRSPVCRRSEIPAAQPGPWLRNRSRIVRSRRARCGCAVRPGSCDSSGAQARYPTAQVPFGARASYVCASVSRGLVAARRVAAPQPAPAARSPQPAARSRAECAGLGDRSDVRGAVRGRACGRAHHDPDHGLRSPFVTVVGLSWSVVGSGPTGFLEVSNIRSDQGV